MDNSTIEQEAAIAATEAKKLISSGNGSVKEFAKLAKSINDKRKELGRPHRVVIKHIDALFYLPLQNLQDAILKSHETK